MGWRQEGAPVNPILVRTRQVLAETGKTQRALAAEGIASQQTLSRIARVDEAEPSAATLATICAKLGINGHWLLTGQGERHVISGGGDAVFAAGVQAGLQRAEEALRALRVTSADAAAVASSLEVEQLVEKAKAGTHRPPRAAGPGDRKRRSAG